MKIYLVQSLLWHPLVIVSEPCVVTWFVLSRGLYHTCRLTAMASKSRRRNDVTCLNLDKISFAYSLSFILLILYTIALYVWIKVMWSFAIFVNSEKKELSGGASILSQCSVGGSKWGYLHPPVYLWRQIQHCTVSQILLVCRPGDGLAAQRHQGHPEKQWLPQLQYYGGAAHAW